VRAGAAVFDITPPLGVPLSGSFTPRPAVGVDDPLYARAVVLEDERGAAGRVAIVCCDVIAIGGDTVMCCDRGRVVVNGVALEEDFLPEGTVNHKYAEITVPEDRLWVLGDNRANSEDSHAHTGEPGGGFVAVDDVVGKVWAIVWPRQHLDIVDRPKVYEQPELDAASGG